MIQTAEADVVGPAVAAEGPHGLLAEEFLVIADELGLVALVTGHSRQQRIGCPAGFGGAFGLINILRTPQRPRPCRPASGRQPSADA